MCIRIENCSKYRSAIMLSPMLCGFPLNFVTNIARAVSCRLNSINSDSSFFLLNYQYKKKRISQFKNSSQNPSIIANSNNNLFQFILIKTKKPKITATYHINPTFIFYFNLTNDTQVAGNQFHFITVHCIKIQ